MTTTQGPRPLDHVVLPVADLAVARDRHERLGFKVAATGVHPFGTENACVYFEDGMFLEPLAIGRREAVEAASRAGNVFAARDLAYRFRRGNEGFSAAVFGTDDAASDDKRYKNAGLTAGDILDFGRDFVAPGGTAGRMEFRLAFAADLRSPDSFFFTCQRINAPKTDRAQLVRHENGAVSIRQVLMSEANPTDFSCFLQEIVDQPDVGKDAYGISIQASNATLIVLDPEGMRAVLAVETGERKRGILLEAVVFGVGELAATRYMLNARAVPCVERGDRLIVRPASGQGATYCFEANV